MAKTKVDLSKELRNMYFDNLFLQRIDCSKDENQRYKEILDNNMPLPEGVYEYKTETDYGTGMFYTVHRSELNQEEKFEYIAFKMMKDINILKNSVLFFVILTVISMLAAVFAIM